MENKVKKIKKRTGEIVDFDQQKITDAIFKAITATGQGDGTKSKKVSEKVVRILNRRFKKAEIPTVEQVQDIVEEVLILEDLVDTARAYILYREQRRRIREATTATDESSDRVDKYIQELDWQIYENANMTFSLQGLNQYAIADISKKYWLNKIYPKEIRDAAFEEDMHIHDLESISTYCCGWDLYDLLKRGFGGVAGKLECRPPKHLRTALGQLVNFFYTLQGECYSEDTEVLTESGWKYFYEVDKEDRVFTLNNKNNEIELQKPTRFYKFENKKEFYNFKTKKIDLLVTPNHNMVVDQYCPKCKGGNYRRKFVKAKDFNSNEDFIPKESVWKGREKKWFTLPGIEIMQYRNFINKPKLAFFSKREDLLILSQPKWKYKIKKIEDKKISMNDWLSFFGFYLAEGNAYARKRLHATGNKTPYYEYTVRIFQNKGKVADEFEKVLKRLPFHYRKKIEKENKVVFEIENKQLYNYLFQFGKRESKFIPQETKNLSKEQLKILFDWMVKGDGYVGNGNTEYYTKSKKLADDVQEIVLKLGWSANIYEKHKAAFKWYCVSVSKTKRFRFKKESIKKIKYSGKVYCLEVPNHTLYIRRKGRACWCGNSAGAQAVSNFDTLIAPFIRYDNLSYPQVKQAMQEFLYNCMVPTRVGFQTPFLNISLDINPPSFLAKQPAIIGGKPQKENYEDFQEEINMLLKAFYEGIMEGDAKGRPFTFPIPTVSIGKDFDWDSQALDALWEATAKYGVNYFSNFIHSDMKPEDFRSMCCRLRLDNKELYMRGGGLFGSQPLTGSIGVVTINLPRIGYLSKTKKEFFDRLAHLMDLAKESLEIKRKALDNFAEKGLYPYSRHYLDSVKKIRGSYFGNHFSTIGLIGMNEALLNFIGEDVGSKRGRKFAAEILDFMREKLVEFQKETGRLYNLEATPGEGTSYRQAKADKEKYSDIVTAGTREAPYYTNSSQLPVNYTDDIFDALKLQNDLQCKYTGGTVLHIFLGERINDPDSAKILVKKIFEKFSLPYVTFTPTFSICPSHGYLSGEHFECPKCTIKQPCEVYSRIVGYIRPVRQWHTGKKQEFKERKEFKMIKKL